MNNKTQKTDYTLTKEDCKRLLREYPELKAAYEQFVKIDFVGDAVMAEHEDYDIQLSDDTVIACGRRSPGGGLGSLSFAVRRGAIRERERPLSATRDPRVGT